MLNLFQDLFTASTFSKICKFKLVPNCMKNSLPVAMCFSIKASMVSPLVPHGVVFTYIHVQ